jgi:phosphoribosylformimino-5-aminoimidazole carboxamide ribotide isomerase
MVSLSGWTETSERRATDAVAELGERGVARFLYTSIEVDGTMEGPAIDDLNAVASATEASVIASGGVGTLADLELLGRVAAPNVEGAIVGRALYEQRFTVAEGNTALG